MAAGEDIIGGSDRPPFFRVANPGDLGVAAPGIRHGDAVRAFVRSLSGFQKETVVLSARTGIAWRLTSDEGDYLDGHDAAPCPLAFLTSGMIASYMAEIRALAAERGIALTRLRITQDNFYTMTGSMRDRTMTGGALPPEIRVEAETDADDAALRQLAQDGIHASPLNGLLRGRLPSLFALGRNGQEIAPGKAAWLNAPLLPDAGAPGEAAMIAPTDLTLVERTGTTPEKAVKGGTAGGGTSLADQQDRTLNPAATATVGEDGITVIDQRLYSPRGSTFRFLSEEAPPDGAGRAPDAATLIAAGIGFCFMTQFGRLASMLKLDLPEYRIVQDLHLSRGGGTGGTGAAGRADPVETHVHLTTTESDDTAREMLDIAERTCFLHALCRTDLKPKLAVGRLA